MSETSFCIANWKMNKNIQESIEYLEEIKKMDLSKSGSEMIICPSYLALNSLIEDEDKGNKIVFGAQNVSSETKGSFTGEISISMLESIACKWVIIGHSERRISIKETDLDIANKMKLVYESKINPILCVGETSMEREDKKTSTVLKRQIISAFKYINFEKKKNILIAYEPIWAIGTGLAADIVSIQSNILIIKNIINNINTKDCNIYILYGGSVDENNASDIFSINGVNGFLIGTSSLNAEKSYDIYRKI